MGYIIKEPTGGDLVKFETFVPSASFNQLQIIPFPLAITQIPNKVFCIVSAFIQYNGSAVANNFQYMYITNAGRTCASYQNTLPSMGLNALGASQFLVNIQIDAIGVQKYGSIYFSNDFFLTVDSILTPRNGDALVTVYGYYFELMTPFV